MATSVRSAGAAVAVPSFATGAKSGLFDGALVAASIESAEAAGGALLFEQAAASVPTSNNPKYFTCSLSAAALAVAPRRSSLRPRGVQRVQQ